MAFIKKGGKSLHGKKSISFYHINSNMYSCISLCIELLQFKNEHEASHSIICRIAFCCCDKREKIAYQSGSKKRRRSNFLLFFIVFLKIGQENSVFKSRDERSFYLHKVTNCVNIYL